MSLSWKLGGLLLGVVFFAAVLLVKPIGVSTQFVVLDGIIWDMINPDIIVDGPEGPSSPNSYLAKEAKDIANPLNYNFLFVIAMMIGAGVSSYLRKGVTPHEANLPELWEANYGRSVIKRFAVAFAGGFIVLFGARLAGGCTSGHMMSGMSQTALSGYVFALGAFLAAIPVARAMYKLGD